VLNGIKFNALQYLENNKMIHKECQHCSEEFERKRKNQKYCGASCRVMACYQRNTYKYKSGSYVTQVKVIQTEQKRGEMTSTDNPMIQAKNKQSLSVEGVGNSFLGAGTVRVLEAIFTKEENKPITKGEAHKLLLPLYEQNQFIINKLKKMDSK
jgi:hypothetical protein